MKNIDQAVAIVKASPEDPGFQITISGLGLIDMEDVSLNLLREDIAELIGKWYDDADVQVVLDCDATE